MKRSQLKRKTPLERQRKKRPSWNPHKLWVEAELISARLAKNAARAQRICQNPDCEDPSADWQAHHVVEAQELRRLGLPRWNTQNVLRLCVRCHARHTGRIAKIPLTALRNENYAYAFRIMGERAYNYLTRCYGGEDPRVNWYLGAVRHGRAV